MSNGRSERRITKTLAITVRSLDQPELNEWTSTQNVSAHGARVLLNRKLEPGKQVWIASPNEGVRSPATIVYCQRVDGNKFAVGLELSTKADPWANPY
jgi:PilZ domain